MKHRTYSLELLSCSKQVVLRCYLRTTLMGLVAPLREMEQCSPTLVRLLITFNGTLVQTERITVLPIVLLSQTEEVYLFVRMRMRRGKCGEQPKTLHLMATSCVSVWRLTPLYRLQLIQDGKQDLVQLHKSKSLSHKDGTIGMVLGGIDLGLTTY